MKNLYEKVSKQITLEGVPVEVSANYWPERGEVTRIQAEVARENPEDKSGLWEVDVPPSRDWERTAFVAEGSKLPGAMRSRHEEKIREAVQEVVRKMEAGEGE